MRRAAISLAAVCLAVLAIVPAPAGADFGLEDLDITFTDSNGLTESQAGAHPFAMTTRLAAITKPEPALGFPIPDGEIQDLVVTLMTGLAGNPTATPRCSSLDFLDAQTLCSDSAAVGVIDLVVGDPTFSEETAVFNLEPPPGVVLKLGFWALGTVPVTIEVGVEPTHPFNPVARPTNISQVIPFYASELTVWGNPLDPAHDTERGACAGVGGAPCPVSIASKPFLTLPRACDGPLASRFEAFSWQGEFFEESIFTHNDVGAPLGFTGCEKLFFSQRVSAQPTTDQAESPSGLDFDLTIEDQGLANPDGIAQSDIKSSVVTLPEGVTLNPSAAEGLLTCSKAGLEAESLDSAPGDGCPEAAKVGTVEAETPILEGKVLKGQLFVAQQDDPATATPGAENPFDSLIALYMVIKDPGLGILVKLAGRVEPNPTTGQIETSFDELPQFPLGHVRINLREGGRSPLISPPRCGTYTTEAVFTPRADPAHPVTTPADFEITSGVGGGPCPPGGPPPFVPGFGAGSLNNNAASFTPFHMRLTRRDGDQDMTKFSSVLPPGLLGKLAGVSKCPQAAIDGAEARTGRAELASPSCPANSQIGRTVAGAGVGSQLTYVPGKVYLAGPYKGAPLSVAVITPAVAGPFDVGTVVVQVGLDLNRRTAEVVADGSASDPIPHILAGIPLKVRDVRVYIDRPNFTLNPTNCSPFRVNAQLWGGGLDLFSTADDSPVPLSARFQAANCANLGFKPALSFRLKGGTRRGAFPALRAVLIPRAGDANLSRTIVRLPKSAFIEQGHFRTICTRVQFAADACPKDATYGHVQAFSPLLEEPLEGPAILRSSDNPLPDLVFDLHGIVDIEASARIDSLRGGLRAIFNGIPDAPVSKVIVSMQGGEKGLFVNSRNLCAHRSNAIVRFDAQNGKRHILRPVVKASCGKKRKGKRQARR